MLMNSAVLCSYWGSRAYQCVLAHKSYQYDYFFGNPVTQAYISTYFNNKYTAGTAWGWYWVSAPDACPLPAGHCAVVAEFARQALCDGKP